MVLEKPASAGFFAPMKSRGGRNRVPATIFSLAVEFRRRALGDLRPQLQ